MIKVEIQSSIFPYGEQTMLLGRTNQRFIIAHCDYRTKGGLFLRELKKIARKLKYYPFLTKGATWNQNYRQLTMNV